MLVCFEAGESKSRHSFSTVPNESETKPNAVEFMTLWWQPASTSSRNRAVGRVLMLVQEGHKWAKWLYRPLTGTCRAEWVTATHTSQTLSLSQLPPFRDSFADRKTYQNRHQFAIVCIFFLYSSVDTRA